MGFFSPWFLAGLAALGLPIYVHLLRRHTSTPVSVSSLMFFERGTQSSVRHRRLRYFLLFSLRALLVLLLVLAFAQPFLKRSTAAASDRLMVLAIDDSFSMQAGTRLADAKREALAVLATRRATQRAQVVLLTDQMQVLTQPVADAAALQAALAGIQPSDLHGNFGELGRGMRALAESVHTPIDLHLFSDIQSSNMPGNFADMVLPGNVSLLLHPAASASIPNWTVESVKAPAQLVDPKKSHVLAVIAGHETPAVTRTASLVIADKVAATKRVDVPANGRATVEFDSLDVPYGTSRCAIRIDSADQFPADDVSLFAVKRADPERVLFVHQSSDARSPLYFGTALASAAQGSFVLQPINVNQAADIDPARYAFIVLSDVSTLPQLFENSLLHFVESGGSVLLAAGASEARAQRLPVVGQMVGEGHFYARGGGTFASAGGMDASHPAVESANGLADTKFFYASSLQPGDGAHTRVLARLADGSPLLLDQSIGQGHAIIFASGFDNVTNDLPLQPAFVPFVDRIARYLAGVEQAGGAKVVDTFVQLRSPSGNAAGTSHGSPVEVMGPGGSRPLSLEQEASAQSFPLTRAGFYQVRFANGHDALIAANPDRRESDLQLIPADTLRLWSGSNAPDAAANPATNTASVTEQQRSTYSLWWWVMLVLLIAALAESIVASGYLGTPREQA